jgi:hypothetical protein
MMEENYSTEGRTCVLTAVSPVAETSKATDAIRSRSQTHARRFRDIDLLRCAGSLLLHRRDLTSQ